MKIKKLTSEICDQYLGIEMISLDEVFDTLMLLKNEFIDHTVLAILDDLGQAKYTSMHACMYHDLDDIEGHDLSEVDLVAFEGGMHIGYLSTTSEFFIRKDSFLEKSTSITFSDVCCGRLTIDDHEISVIEKIHFTPINYIDREIELILVPVQKAALAISAFPNGYFADDLNPFENYALAKHLEENYGYELFSMGASLLGFKRSDPLDRPLSSKLAKDLSKLYGREDDETVIERFSKLTQNFNYLFLKYVEYLEY
ncbi:MAG: hypothetical protein HWE24_02365 [Oceanospirillaceae bacterium]|nr:hypothetical protein [Oceanospirillaceae bacterium]